jgi:hypothetical protein
MRLSNTPCIDYWKVSLRLYLSIVFQGLSNDETVKHAYRSSCVFWTNFSREKSNVITYIEQHLLGADATLSDVACVFMIAKSDVKNTAEIAKLLEDLKVPNALVNKLK